MKSRLLSGVAFLALVLGATGQTQPATNTTAFALARAGNQYLAAEARDKVLEIHSEKSDGNLAPDIWHVDYYDPTAPFKITEVKFVFGKMAETKRLHRVLQWVSGSKPLEWGKLKIDSDAALAIARKQPELKHLDLRAAQFWLERTPTEANWKIRLWAAWPGGVTDIYVSARTGKVVGSEDRRQRHK